MFLGEVNEQLLEHAHRFDLENRAVESCKEYVQTLLVEYPEETRFYLRGLPPENLAFVFVKHDLVFGSYRSWPHILSRVAFGRRRENTISDVNSVDNVEFLDIEPFGYYALETVENGEVNDDWFSWEQMRDEEGKLTEFSSVWE